VQRLLVQSLCYKPLLGAEFRDALGAANEVVDQRTDPMSENYDQYPDQFVVALTGLPGCALDDHKHPEDGATYGENQEEEQADHNSRIVRCVP